MPRRIKKAKTKSKRKTNPNRTYSYAFLTMGYTRFVQLTPERVARLPEREKKNIEKMALYKEDIRLYTKQDWQDLLNGGFREGVISRVKEIVKGTAVAQAEVTKIENYVIGLNLMGENGLAKRFKDLSYKLKDEHPDIYEVFEDEIPDLFLIYKDKGRSHVKRQATYSQTVAEDQVILLEKVVKEYEDILENVESEATKNEGSGEE